MGVPLKELIQGKEVSTKDLADKVIVIDAFNMLYQFLSSIRARDGALLTNSKGEVTSHLVGLFNRLSTFLEQGMKPVFIFDGEAPSLKKEERERRKKVKKDAQAKYEIASEEKDVEGMKKYASRTATLSKDMVVQSKKLLDALGVPHLTAPSEGEAQAAFIVSQGDAYASVSQDIDSLLFGCPLLVRNLSLSGRRKRIRGVGTKIIKPEIITLSHVLNELGMDRDGLIALSMLVGTDYNRGGIKGIGPKNALKLVKKHANDYETLFKEVGWDDVFPFPWTEVFYLFKKMPVEKKYSFSWKPVDEGALRTFLIQEQEFEETRVENVLKKLEKQAQAGKQKGLGEFF